jgi:hypothetical protein
VPFPLIHHRAANNRFERSRGMISGEPWKKSMIWTKRLRLPPTQARAALAIRDIRDTEDIDPVATPRLLDELAARGWRPKARPSGKPGLKFAGAKAYLDVNCEAFGRSTSRLLEHAERVRDTFLVDLSTLAQFKAGYGRDKDVRDLQPIGEHMRAQPHRKADGRSYSPCN